MTPKCYALISCHFLLQCPLTNVYCMCEIKLSDSQQCQKNSPNYCKGSIPHAVHRYFPFSFRFFLDLWECHNCSLQKAINARGTPLAFGRLQTDSSVTCNVLHRISDRFYPPPFATLHPPTCFCPPWLAPRLTVNTRLPLIQPTKHVWGI